ncbi:PQQ-binding-like beta-propeller repeat protein [Streptomyces sp. NPDC058409]|uniref:outer membrane protein assembly factor BamB family protein n=1 Tax=Streptomyces sp. NPDC058409 TaxID=3346484 RepID=UPI003657FA99
MDLLGEPDAVASRRLRWFMALVVVCLTLAWLYDWYAERDRVTGAQGPFPAVFAAGSPVAPEHVIRRSAGVDVTLVHGMSLEWTGPGVKAVNLRTGKEYWRYERRDSGGTMWSFEVSARTVVAGFDDGKLVGIDLRTGKPLWHEKIPHDDGFRGVSLTGGQAVTEAPGAVRAFDERDGRSLWTVKTPGNCPEVLVHTVYALPDHVSAVHAMCNVSSVTKDEYSLLLGIDNRTGELLWQRRTRDPEQVVRGDAHTLVAPAPGPGGRTYVQLLDVNREGATARGELATDSWNPAGAGDGTVLVGADADGGTEDHITVLHAFDTTDGHLAWRLKAPSGREYGFGKIADGRVYVVRQPFLTGADVGRRIRADLLVLDADTGRLLHTLRLPAMTVPDDSDHFVKLDVLDVADGATSIGWRDDDGDLLIAAD